MEAPTADDASTPDETPTMAAMGRFVSPPVSTVVMDDLDRRIVDLLRSDARMSHRALAREISVSPPTIRDRIARLERLGIIRGYEVSIGWAEVGYPMDTFLSISVAAGADLAAVIDGLTSIPEVVAVHVVTGQWDVLARFRLIDHANLQGVLLGRVWQIPGIRRVETHLELVGIETAGPVGRPRS
ncbi:Lrp/AsnC family transcriptional regulator [Microbacterium aurantiacum]|uniref:Lrp/AsnC family transcriptional regulator n=1 Tax=Microbacterium aurantiacum TaxID=162393 RepID=UPI00341E2500